MDFSFFFSNCNCKAHLFRHKESSFWMMECVNHHSGFWWLFNWKLLSSANDSLDNPPAGLDYGWIKRFHLNPNFQRDAFSLNEKWIGSPTQKLHVIREGWDNVIKWISGSRPLTMGIINQKFKTMSFGKCSLCMSSNSGQSGEENQKRFVPDGIDNDMTNIIQLMIWLLHLGFFETNSRQFTPPVWWFAIAVEKSLLGKLNFDVFLLFSHKLISSLPGIKNKREWKLWNEKLENHSRLQWIFNFSIFQQERDMYISFVNCRVFHSTSNSTLPFVSLMLYSLRRGQRGRQGLGGSYGNGRPMSSDGQDNRANRINLS